MTSAHRYPQHPPNPPKLPSLRDLNFYRPSGPQAALPPSQQPEQPVLQPEQPSQPARHQVVWSRSPANPYASSSSAAAAAHQQYAPQLSQGHEVTPKVEFPQKHENTGYAHPGMPLSAQTNPVPGSLNSGPSRADDSPNQPKKQRTASTTTSRDVRGSHVRFFLCFEFLQIIKLCSSLMDIRHSTRHMHLRLNRSRRAHITLCSRICPLPHLRMPLNLHRRLMSRSNTIHIQCQ